MADHAAPARAVAAPKLILLLWVAGLGLRLPVLTVPPVIPQLHDAFGLSETGIGILSGLPMLMFAWGAIPGSLLIARAGALRVLIGGLAVTAAATALRAAAQDVAVLYAATAMLGIGIAVAQPALPRLVRTWMPDRIGFGTTVYINGMGIGQILV